MRNILNGRPGSTIPDPNLLRVHKPMLSGNTGMGMGMGRIPPSQLSSPLLPPPKDIYDMTPDKELA
jgi:hypothetical protein